MTKIRHSPNDGRREARRPSRWFVLTLLGLVSFVAVSVWLHSSSSDARLPPQSVMRAGDGPANAELERDYMPLHVPAATTTREANRDALTEWLRATLPGLESGTDPVAQEERIAAWMEAISYSEIPAVLSRLQSSSNALALELGARLASRWAEADPKAASAWAVAQPEGALRNTALDQSAIAWAEANWSEAADWARQLSNETDRDRAVRLIAEEVVRSEPIEALRLVAEVSPGTQRGELIQRAAMEWATTDATSAAQWAQSIDDVDLRSQVLGGIAMAWAEQDVHAAVTLAVSSMPSGRMQANALVGIAGRWVQVDTVATSAWVAQFPPGGLREDAIETVVSLWSLNDAAQAEQWRVQVAATP